MRRRTTCCVLAATIVSVRFRREIDPSVFMRTVPGAGVTFGAGDLFFTASSERATMNLESHDTFTMNKNGSQQLSWSAQRRDRHMAAPPPRILGNISPNPLNYLQEQEARDQIVTSQDHRHESPGVPGRGSNTQNSAPLVQGGRYSTESPLHPDSFNHHPSRPNSQGRDSLGEMLHLLLSGSVKSKSRTRPKSVPTRSLPGWFVSNNCAWTSSTAIQGSGVHFVNSSQ
ncbi:hypothetical protein B0J18DRAFT_437406 [Chaetomium sp. MPI-SDFR-AT-0129]|nr:hypothetical protein B0J18DRAFT_437406 [Chaetomium sp. MPI-SDFR-AT-0129]